MINSQGLIRKILKDIKVQATEEFDRNFERKGFFQPNTWADTKRHNPKGSLMLRSGKLRRSIKSVIRGSSVVFTSDMPYAGIHNEGGEIQLPARKHVAHFDKNGRFAREKSKRAKYAQKFDIGSHKIKIPQRQFIGAHPVLFQQIEEIIYNNVGTFFNDYFNGKKTRV